MIIYIFYTMHKTIHLNLDDSTILLGISSVLLTFPADSLKYNPYTQEGDTMAKRNAKLNNAVYTTVKNDVIDGKYPGGTFITEADLCAQFGVSRTPVREALIRLSNERIIELIPNRGALVPHISLSDIIELYQLRIANDGMAAYLSNERQTPELLKSMEESISREEQLLADGEFPQAISREDFVFHDLLVKGCGNQRLIDTITLLQNEMDRIVRISADQYAIDTLTVSLDYHRQILQAFRSGDRHKGRSLVEDHWKAAQDGYIKRSLGGYLSTLL